ncbi:MAG: squalene--hopene cyclase [Acidobacteriota bacterium]|nr:squalene--hopene cyclase [Acidobacteriota bacterium]
MIRAESAAREVAAERLPRVVAAAQSWLLSAQNADGHWCGELEGDSILESDYVLLLHFLGRLGDARVGKAARYLREQQLAAGGWPIYPGGPPDVSASVKAYFVLKLAGDDPAGPHMQKARDTIRGLGGIDACNSFTKLYLAICGEYDWWSCPAIPPEMVLLPRWFYFNIYAMSSWSRAIVVPLSIVWAVRPVQPVPAGKGISELRVPTARRSGSGIMSGSSPFWRGFFHLLDLGLKLGEKLRLTPFRKRSIALAKAWMLERIEDSDGLGAIFPPIVNSVIALRCLGYPADHPTVQAQVRELEKLEIEENGSLRLQPCFSAVWDTALALHSLAESGLSPSHPALAAGKRWLLDHEVRQTGDWSLKAPGTAAGGWCFEYRNPFYPDCDDTAEVLTALAALAANGENGEEGAAMRGVAWLLAMQNEDGGWGAFDRACDNEILTHVPFADHNALLDPSTSDVTGRILDCLGRLGFAGGAPAIRKAVAFLRAQQEEDGTWYGRWGCNYIYGTWLALSGLSRFGNIGREEWCRKAAAWLTAHQNPDGGWGESPLSYDDPSQKGIGPSTAAQTSWALLALFAADVRTGPAVERGIDYLAATQLPDGSWRDEPWTATGFPRVFYLRYHLYATFFPLMALAEYAHSRGERPQLHPPQPYPHEVPVRSGAIEGAAR